MEFETVIGLEVHAELQTRSKMFCACPVLDATRAEPNAAVCPVCAGMPGTLPVVNRQAVELALRVALALECQVAPTSLFARKNYFYPDLPKGYQISQYEYPLAEHGRLIIQTQSGERSIRIRRAHLEEDTGKLTHMEKDGETYSLVDLNRAGVPLLEVVTEPDLHTVEEVRAYASGLRAILRAVKANSGDMEKGVLRFEANVSLRPAGIEQLGTRVEIKNLNSFKALERSVVYEIERQQKVLEAGGVVVQETLGWDEANGCTYSQRSKEEAHDYRYFPEPDLPPLVVEDEWVERVRAGLPELPRARQLRMQSEYGLSTVDARILVEDSAVADYFEACTAAAGGVEARTVSAWMLGELFGWMNQTGMGIEQVKVLPEALAELLQAAGSGQVNQTTAKAIFAEMLTSGKRAPEIIATKGLEQISDEGAIADMVSRVLQGHPAEVDAYRQGKETLLNWFLGQVMRLARGKANPQMVQDELSRQLDDFKKG